MSRNKKTNSRASSKAKKRSALESLKQNLKHRMADWAIIPLKKYHQMKEKMREKGYYKSAENFLERFNTQR